MTIEMTDHNMKTLEEAFQWAFEVGKDGTNGECSAAGLAYKTIMQMNNPEYDASPPDAPVFVKQADPELERLLAEEEEIERSARAWAAAGFGIEETRKVKSGAAFLTDYFNVEYWRDWIHLDTFDITSGECCVLAQMWLGSKHLSANSQNYSKMKNKMNLTVEDCRKYGFNHDKSGSTAAALQAAWVYFLKNGGF